MMETRESDTRLSAIEMTTIQDKSSLSGSKKPSRRKKGAVALYLLLVATLVLTICSKSSPLYPFNDWVDANCFFTVGKSMLSGLMPYRDLWEQKGPFLYMLHALAALVSYRTFFGVYLLEILAAFGFLWYGYRACRVLTDKPGVLAFLTMMAGLVFSSRPFAHGDSVEQLALAPLAYALYQGLLVVERQQLLSWWQAMAIGVTSGMVFWSKFTLVGLYVGWFIVVAMITGKQGGVRALFRLIGGILCGLLLVTVPILAYFLVQGALSDLVEGYFFANLFSYSRVDGEGSSLISNLQTGYSLARTTLGIVFSMGALGLFWSLLYRPVRTFVHLLLQALFLLLFIYIGGRFYVYYALPMALFAVVGCAALASWLDVFLRRFSRAPSPHVLVLVALFLSLEYAFLFSPNAYLRGTPREEMPQYRFARLIQKKEKPTLLNYGFLDGGFYTVSGIIPHVRAFCRLNLPSSKQEEEQDEVIRQCAVDFIVTRGEEREFAGYRIIDRTDFFFEAPQHYALYEKMEK